MSVPTRRQQAQTPPRRQQQQIARPLLQQAQPRPVCLPAAAAVAEGISFLGVYGIAAWSIYSKVKTGSGLPAGPSGLLGAVEGISFLTVLACE
jgi:hypothetical protein